MTGKSHWKLVLTSFDLKTLVFVLPPFRNDLWHKHKQLWASIHQRHKFYLLEEVWLLSFLRHVEFKCFTIDRSDFNWFQVLWHSSWTSGLLVTFLTYFCFDDNFFIPVPGWFIIIIHSKLSVFCSHCCCLLYVLFWLFLSNSQSWEVFLLSAGPASK